MLEGQLYFVKILFNSQTLCGKDSRFKNPIKFQVNKVLCLLSLNFKVKTRSFQIEKNSR